MAGTQGRWWLTGDSHQIVIATTPEHLYDLVADLPRMGEWSLECTRVDWADGPAPVEAGSRFVGHNRGGPFQLFRWSRQGRVLTADRGREFAGETSTNAGRRPRRRDGADSRPGLSGSGYGHGVGA